MNKLDLNDYSDDEIVKAFFNMSATKFLAVLNALGSISKRIENRGSEIADDTPDDVVDRMIRSVFEE